jgi:hypothetical protein
MYTHNNASAKQESLEQPNVSPYFSPQQTEITADPELAFDELVLYHLTVPNDLSHKEYYDKFSDTASFLLCGCLLRLSDQLFRLLEIEFYLFSPSHEDPFCHANRDQRSVAKWYFHRAGPGPNAGYRGGSRKGVDLTFGQPDGSAAGGILLRSMCQVDEKGEDVPDRVISGPSKLVDELVSLSGADSIEHVKTSSCYSLSFLSLIVYIFFIAG